MKIQAWGDVVFPADNPKNYCTSFKKYVKNIRFPQKIINVCVYSRRIQYLFKLWLNGMCINVGI